MRLNVKGKEAFGVTVLTLVVVVGSTFLNLSQLSSVIVQETSEQVSLIKRQIFEYSKRVVLNAQSPDMHPVVLLATNQELKKFLEASVGYSPHLLYALIVDPQGKTLLHSEGAKTERTHPIRPKLEDLLSLGPIDRFTVLYQEGSIFDSTLPITWENVPIGKVIVGIHTSLLRERMTSSLKTSVVFALVALPIAWLLTMGLATLTLRPIHALAEQMEQLRQGRFDVLTDLSRTDEFRELASQLQLLGQQLKSDRLKTLSEETHLQGVIEHLEDGVIVIDDQGKTLFLNQAMEFMVDIPGPHLPGHRLESLGESFTPLIRLVNQALAEKKDLKAVPCSLPRKGELKSFYISVIYLRSSPRFHGAMILCRDIESMKTLQSLVRYAAQLTTLGQLTSGLAHEVKNPLNAMVIHLEILKEEAKGLNGDFQKSLEVLEGEVHRLDRVVLGFLKFMRPQELELSSVNVNQLLQRELSLVEREWGNKGIRFVLDFESDLPAISADPDLLSQVFLNIILNACQAMEEQGGDIRVATSTHQDNEIRISISDQGPGIPPEMQEKIFQLYYTTKHHGSGLGLSLVYRFIQLHEGVIDVQTEMGKGTTFNIRLPRNI
ncbi:ATP-binding protein [Candidatus Nitrospira neomarina]|uniref:histidine kinase n=1 Tax=Candidatus Nitrospira neomarina TaxID=3020899 RepID=A0AA96GRF6_9BACT|nr:ATP-binding protein [Candidatus Nitrospira neomarina]WNM62186.1 ATP-binding protein [Candidatus Nitrospira neomarina]